VSDAGKPEEQKICFLWDFFQNFRCQNGVLSEGKSAWSGFKMASENHGGFVFLMSRA
jgi:hypothetical protein